MVFISAGILEALCFFIGRIPSSSPERGGQYATNKRVNALGVSSVRRTCLRLADLECNGVVWVVAALFTDKEWAFFEGGRSKHEGSFLFLSLLCL